jgi:hypothetical protein
MRTAVEGGEFDHEIAAALHGAANVGGIAEFRFLPNATATRIPFGGPNRTQRWLVRGATPTGH